MVTAAISEQKNVPGLWPKTNLESVFIYKINRRPSPSKRNSTRSKAQIKRREHEKSSVRAKTEHVFAVAKQQYQYRKAKMPSPLFCLFNFLFLRGPLSLDSMRCFLPLGKKS